MCVTYCCAVLNVTEGTGRDRRRRREMVESAAKVDKLSSSAKH